MPFLQFTMSHIAQSHLFRPRGESSKIVPTLIENCFLACLLLHSHNRRVERKRTSVLPHVGHITPFGQRRVTRVFRQLSGFEKYSMASCSVLGSPCMVS